MKNENIVSEIYGSFFEHVSNFLDKSIHEFHKSNRDDIQIFMPSYFQSMFSKYMASVVCFYDSDLSMEKYRGVQIFDNYQNNIIVSCKNIQLSGLNYFSLKIP